MLIDRANKVLEITIFNVDMFSRNPLIKNERRLDVKCLEFERTLSNVAEQGLDYTLSTDRTDVSRDIRIITKTLTFVVA